MIDEMISRNQDFLRKVRLCLYLIFGLGLFGCSVLKPRNGNGANIKTYRISCDLLPGYKESSLFTALDGTVIINIDRSPAKAGFAALPEQFTLWVSVNNETDLQRVLQKLQYAGFRIRGFYLTKLIDE